MHLLHIICTVIFLIQGLRGTDALFFSSIHPRRWEPIIFQEQSYKIAAVFFLLAHFPPFSSLTQKPLKMACIVGDNEGTTPTHYEKHRDTHCRCWDSFSFPKPPAATHQSTVSFPPLSWLGFYFPILCFSIVCYCNWMSVDQYEQKVEDKRLGIWWPGQHRAFPASMRAWVSSLQLVYNTESSF